MSAKLILFVCFAVFTVAFTMPSGPAKEGPKEDMKTAETIHLPFSFNFGGYPSRYGPYGYRRGGFGFGFDFGQHYDPYNDGYPGPYYPYRY